MNLFPPEHYLRKLIENQFVKNCKMSSSQRRGKQRVQFIAGGYPHPDQEQLNEYLRPQGHLGNSSGSRPIIRNLPAKMTTCWNHFQYSKAINNRRHAIRNRSTKIWMDWNNKTAVKNARRVMRPGSGGGAFKKTAPGRAGQFPKTVKWRKARDIRAGKRTLEEKGQDLEQASIIF